MKHITRFVVAAVLGVLGLALPSSAQAGWTVSPATLDPADTIRTDGDLVAAYSILGGEVNTVPFVRTIPVTSSLSPNPAPVASKFGDYRACGASGNYGNILSHASYWNSGNGTTLTFSGLTAGRQYLIQLISHNIKGSGVTISVEGSTPKPIGSGDTASAEYYRGASIVGIFTATAATKTITVTFTGLSDSGQAGEGTLNAIQIRDLGNPALARYSTDGGTSWTDVADVDAAFAAAGTTDMIIEPLADGTFLGTSLGSTGWTAPSCNITLRSPSGSKYTLTCANTDASAGWVMPNGKSVTISNITLNAGSSTKMGFLRTADGSKTAELHLGPGATVTASGDAAGKCIWFSGKIYFDGGVVSGWKTGATQSLIGDQGNSSGGFYIEINDGGIENCTTGGGPYRSLIGGWKVNDLTNPFFKMNGGFIRNNTMTSSECPGLIGAVNGVVALTGGVIANNICDNYVFNLLPDYSSGRYIDVRVSGNPVVYNNYNLAGTAQKNVYADGPTHFTQIGDLTAGAKIGVTAPSGASAAGETFGMLNAAGHTGASYIVNDADSTLVGTADGTNLKWGVSLARYSLDGGASWTYVADVDAAYDAIKDQSAAAIIEALADGPIMSGRNFYGAQCDITLRSPAGGSVHTLTHTGYGDGAGWIVEDGYDLTLSNIVLNAALGNGYLELGFIRTPAEVPTTSELHLGPGSVVTSSSSHDTYAAGTCIRFGGKVYFDGGVLSGWNCKSNKYLICPQNGCGSTFYLEINAGGIENCDTSNGCYAWDVMDNHLFFKMTGGFIRNCRIDRIDTPVGFVSSRKGTAYVSGGVITNNYCGIGGVLGPATTFGKIYVQVSGNPVIYDNTGYELSQLNIYAVDNGCFTQVGDLTEGAKIGVYCTAASAAGNTFGTRSSTSYTGAFRIKNDINQTLLATASNANLQWAEMVARYSTDGGASWTETVTFDDATAAVSAQTSPAIIEVLKDCTFWSCTDAQCDITLRTKPGLATCTVTCNNSKQEQNCWAVPAGLNLVISNLVMSAGNFVHSQGLINVAAGSTLELGPGSRLTTSSETYNNGGCVRTAGMVYFRGGVISDWKSTQSGAAVIYTATTGRVHIEDGGIENCSADSNLNWMGATAVAGSNNNFGTTADPVFTMTGGFIRNNNTQNDQSVIRFTWAPWISITGGAITNNTGAATSGYQAVFIGDNGKTIDIGGDAIIYDNTDANGAQRNINVESNVSQLRLVSDLLDGAKIGVTSANRYSEGEVFGTATAGVAGAPNIVNDKNSSLVGSLDGTNLKWANYVATVVLTVPVKTGLEKPTVTSTDGDVSPTTAESGYYAWKVPMNATATLTYTASLGYKIDPASPVSNPVEVAIAEADVTLTAAQLPSVLVVQVFAVTFNADGGSPTPAAQQVNDGDCATVPSPSPTKSGHSFEGWFRGSVQWNFADPVTGNMTLKAKWAEVPQGAVRYSADEQTWYWTNTVGAAYTALKDLITTAEWGYIEVCQNLNPTSSEDWNFARNLMLRSYSRGTTRYTIGGNKLICRPQAGYTLKIENLQFNSGWRDGSGKPIFAPQGTLELAEGTLVTSQGNDVSQNYAVLLDASTARLNITGGVITWMSDFTFGSVGLSSGASGAQITLSAGGFKNCYIKRSGYGPALQVASGMTFTMTGGEISGCHQAGTEQSCGAIIVENGGMMVMTGGVISGNRGDGLKNRFGSVHIKDGGLLQLSGSPVIRDNLLYTDDVVSQASNVSAEKNDAIELVDDLADGAYIGVDYPMSGLKSGTQFAVTSLTEEGKKRRGADCFHADLNDELYGINTGATLVWSVNPSSAPVRYSYDGTVWMGATDVEGAYNAMTADGIIEVNCDQDFPLTGIMYINKNITLRSNSDNDPVQIFRLTRTWYRAGSFHVNLYVNPGCKMVIENIEIDCGNSASLAEGGRAEAFADVLGEMTLLPGALLLESGDTATAASCVQVVGTGHLKIAGGYIGGWKSNHQSYGAVTFNEGSYGIVAITSGGITNCSVACSDSMHSGSAIFNHYNAYGTINLLGGEISGNCGYGAAVATIASPDAASVVNLTGTRITGNRTGSSCGALNVGGTLNVSGTPVVTGNTCVTDATAALDVNASNLYQVGDILPGAQIGVCFKNGAGTVFGTWTDGEGAKYFECDENKQLTGIVDGSNLKWRVDPSRQPVRYSTDNGTTWFGVASLTAASTALGASDGIVEINLPLTNETAVAFSGNVTLRSNSERDERDPYTLFCRGAGMFTAPSGKTLTVADITVTAETPSAALFNVVGGLDLSADATLTGTGVMTFPAVTLGSGSTLTVAGGVIESWQYGVAASAPIVNTGTTTITMSNGAVRYCSGAVAPIQLSYGATMNLTGGEIADNTSSGVNSVGGAIYVANGAKLNISGSPYVYDNTAGGAPSDIVPQSADLIKLVGELGDTTVGVNFPLPLADSAFGVKGAGAANPGAFVCNGCDSLTGKFSGDKLVWNFREAVPVRYRMGADGTSWGDWIDASSVNAAVAAINASANAYGEIEILGNQTLALGAVLTVSKNITLRSNSDGSEIYELTRTMTGSTAYEVECAAGSSLTLENIVVDGNAGQVTEPLFDIYSSLTLADGATVTSGTVGGVAAVNVRAGATLAITGGTIDGWQSTGAAAVTVLEAGSVTISAGGIRNCDGGAGSATAVYLGSTGASFAMTGGEIADNTSSGDAAAVHAINGATVTVGGTAVLAGNTTAGGANANLRLVNAETLQQTSALKEGASIGVDYPTPAAVGGPFGTWTVGDGAKYFFCDNNPKLCGLAKNDNTLVWAEDFYAFNLRYTVNAADNLAGATWTGADTLADAATALTAGGTIEANRDYTDASVSVTFAGTVTLQSNSDDPDSYLITRGGATTWTVGSGAAVTVKTLSIDGNAQGADLFTVNAGGALTLDSDLTLYSAAAAGGAVKLNGGSLALTGAVIDGWNVSDAAAAGTAVIYDVAVSTATISGGRIVNCLNEKGGDAGAAVSVLTSGSTLVLTGGEISGNRHSGDAANGGGIWAAAGTTVSVSGSPKVQNNQCGVERKACNLHPADATVIKLAGDIAATAYIGVDYPAEAGIACYDPFGGVTAAAATGAENFHHDKKVSWIGMKSSDDTQLIWAVREDAAPVRWSVSGTGDWVGATDIAAAYSQLTTGGFIEINFDQEFLGDAIAFDGDKTVVLRSNSDDATNATFSVYKLTREAARTFSVAGGSLVISNLTLDANGKSADLLKASAGALTLGADCTLVNGSDDETWTGVKVNGGEVTMDGAEIRGFTTGNDGHPVEVSSGSFTLTSGAIVDCHRFNTELSPGGAVLVSGGTMNVADGEITGNIAEWGSDENGYGAGILVNGSGHLNFTGGTPVVTNNVCGSVKGDISTADSATRISLTGNLATGASVGVSQPVAVESIVSGTTPFGLAASAFEGSDSFFYTAAPSVLCGGIQGGNLVWEAGDDPDNFCVRYKANSASTWNYTTSLKDAFDRVGEGVASTVEIGCDLEYRFTGDYSLVNKQITLQSSSETGAPKYRLTRNSASAIAVGASAALTVQDIDIFAGQSIGSTLFAVTGGGALTLGEGSTAYGSPDYTTTATMFTVRDAGSAFTINGGEIHDWHASGIYGVIDLGVSEDATSAGASLTMSAGSIRNCTATMGTVIELSHACTFSMTGGEITDCSVTIDQITSGYGAIVAARDHAVTVSISGTALIANNSVERKETSTKSMGSAVQVHAGTINLTGGTITNNTAVTAGKMSGVYAAAGVTVNVSGSPVVGYNLNAADGLGYGICPATATQIKQTGDLASTAAVGVTYPSVPDGTAQKFGEASTEYANANRFYHTTTVGLNGKYSSGDLVWDTNSDTSPVRYSADGGSTWWPALSLEGAIAADRMSEGGIIEVHGAVDYGASAASFIAGKNYVLRSYTGTVDPGVATLGRTAATSLTVPAGTTLTVSNIVTDAKGTTADLFTVAGVLTLGEDGLLTNSGKAVTASAAGAVDGGVIAFAGGYVDGWKALAAAAVTASGTGSKVTLASGGVINCSSSLKSSDYGAIYATSPAAIELSGAPVVTNNFAAGVAADLVTTSADVITLVDDLASGAAVGVLYPATVPASGTVFGIATAGKTVPDGAIYYSTTPKVTGVVDGTTLKWQVPGTEDDFLVRHKKVSEPDSAWVYDLTVQQALELITTSDEYYIEIGCNQTLALDSNLAIGERNVTLRSSTAEGSTAVYSLVRGGAYAVQVNTAGSSLTLENIVMDGGGAKNDECFFKVSKGTFVMSDGAVIRNAVRTTDGFVEATGAAVIVSGNGAKFEMEGGEIRECSSASRHEEYSGIVVVGSGAAGVFEMSGGAITNNVGVKNSAVLLNGIAADRKAVFTMTGGVIAGNRTTESAVTRAAVYAVRNAEFEMTGGRIVGNSGAELTLAAATKVRNYGVYASESTATLTFGGAAYVRDNCAGAAGSSQANVYGGVNADTGYQIKYAGFTSGACVGVSNDSGNSEEFANKLDTVTSDTAVKNAKYFFYDDKFVEDAAKLTVGEVSGSTVVWAVRPNPWNDIPVWMCDVVFPFLDFTGLDLGAGVQDAFTNVWDRTGATPVHLEPGKHFTVDEVSATRVGTYGTVLRGITGSGYSDKTNVTFKIVGDKVDATGGKLQVAVTKAWKTAKDIGKSKTLETVGANGLKYWQSYALGIEPDAKTFGQYRQNAEPLKQPVAFENFDPTQMPEDSNLDIAYVLQSATQPNGTWTATEYKAFTNTQDRIEFTTDVPASGVIYYRLNYRFTDQVKPEEEK